MDKCLGHNVLVLPTRHVLTSGAGSCKKCKGTHTQHVRMVNQHATRAFMSYRCWCHRVSAAAALSAAEVSAVAMCDRAVCNDKNDVVTDEANARQPKRPSKTCDMTRVRESDKHITPTIQG
jgi:hypothetical protein